MAGSDPSCGSAAWQGGAVANAAASRPDAAGARHEAERRFATLVANLPGMAYRCRNDASWTMEFVSEGGLALTGYSAADLTDSARVAYGDLIVPEDRARVWETVQSALAQRGPFEMNYRLTTASGEVRDVWERGRGVFDGDGRLEALEGFIVDVSSFRRSEEQLRESRHVLATILDAIPQFVFWKDRRSVYQGCNRPFARAIGFADASGVVGKSDFELPLPRADAEAYRADDRAVMERREPRSHILEPMQHADGRRLWVETTKVPLVDAAGTVVGLLGICEDVTDRKRAEEERQQLDRQIQQAQKMESLGILAGGIAHDFNNLLMAIMGNINLALLDLSPVSPVREPLVEAEAATQRAADLARQMLAYSGRGRFAVQRLNLRELIEEMDQMLRVAISRKAALRFNFAAAVPEVEADAAQLRQAVLNLVVNGAEALGNQSGTVTVSTGAMDCDRAYLADTWLQDALPEGRYACIEVSDSGCGIPREQFSKIFDPFFSTKFTGRGLGLPAVLGIVRGHRGAIKVYSEVGRGSTFKLLLPAAPQPVEAAPPPPEPVAWKGNGVLLLVDDEEAVRSTARKMIERLGYEVVAAADGLEAVEIFRARGAAIAGVLLDLTMPNMDGEETFRELRRIRADTRVILSSGYHEADVVQRFIGKGLAGFIQKPYTLAKLRDAFQAAKLPSSG